ncbi:MAG: hypothetical protein AB7F40_02650 [Victivallaceae bacterium]|nr:hypothetical protein [Victivallaceae bacterium]
MKKLACLFAAALLAGCASPHGLVEITWTPVQMGLPGPLMLAVTGDAENSMPSVYGLMGPFTSGADDFIGIGASLTAGAKNSYGLCAGLVTLNRNNYGLAAGGLYNYSENNYGVELGIFNTVIPVLMSASERNNFGLQLGVFNIAANSGVQFGLINGTGPTDDGGIQIGLLNFDDDGFMPFFNINRAIPTATDEADLGLDTNL